jgi:L,D-transpeptidase ErfK/SrfK
MHNKKNFKFSRRAFVSGTCAIGLSVGSGVRAQTVSGTTEIEADISPVVRRNISSFRSLEWRPYFKNLRKGAILVDITSRALHMWTEKENYSLYPTSVPMTDDLIKFGRTSVVKKVVGPTWSPTPEMKKRNPEWPDFVPAGPDNPLGTHALYLGWRYYRIHGTHDTRKIGRRSSNGCIGLYNEQIAEVFKQSVVGTQVLVI